MTRFFPLPPKRGFQRAAGENGAVRGDMAQNDALAGGGEGSVVFSTDITAANRGKGKITAFGGTGDAMLVLLKPDRQCVVCCESLPSMLSS